MNTLEQKVADAKAAMATPAAPAAIVGPASAAPKTGREIGDNPPPASPPPNPVNFNPKKEDLGSKPAGGKTYHNTHPGSTYIAKSGVVYSFDHKGELTVTDPDVIKELDAIADKPGCPVYTKGSAQPAPGDSTPVYEIQKKAAETMADIAAQAAQRVGH